METALVLFLAGWLIWQYESLRRLKAEVRRLREHAGLREMTGKEVDASVPQ